MIHKRKLSINKTSSKWKGLLSSKERKKERKRQQPGKRVSGQAGDRKKIFVKYLQITDLTKGS
jgi:hypothetical protein